MRARAEAGDQPLSFLHVTKAEIDLDPAIDSHSTAVYEKAKENLNRMVAEGVLFRENKPCYYIYRLVMNGRSQTGLVCLSSVKDYFDDVIKKHEFTRPEKEKDRIHSGASGAQAGSSRQAPAGRAGNGHLVPAAGHKMNNMGAAAECLTAFCAAPRGFYLISSAITSFLDSVSK